MFCNQCEQTAKGIACEVKGVCGKNAEVSALQDLVLCSVKELSVLANEAKEKGLELEKFNRFTIESIFTTLTNVNFDSNSLAKYVLDVQFLANELAQQIQKPVPEFFNKITQAKSTKELELLGEEFRLIIDENATEDIQSLQQILIYGIKGVAAYAYHAYVLGNEDERIYSFIHEALATINRDRSLAEWVELVLKCGEINLIAMEILDDANTKTYGHPVPTSVPLGQKKGKAILVSGHDLKDLFDLLKATEGKGINIYTHGEMLPAHGYPELKNFSHFYGHYGTAWQNQRKEFVDFPGPILMTTNCIQEPKDSYIDSIFTTGTVAWPGVTHVENGQFDKLIDKAQQMPGFEEDIDKGEVMTGFARNAVLSVADKIVEGVKQEKIKHFMLVGGCDGIKSDRNYYTELVDRSPKDTVILTLGCGKFRFFDHKIGEIDGIPRLLDIGQCNDAYSAVKIALALAEAFECGVNDLPLSLVLSWYEQKAVSILLTLLYLDIKDIRLGPSLPAFISEGVLNVLVENYGIKPISTVEEDLQTILG
ncbi:Hydroxylamine reductase [Candidatus Syntrophocurvum alkaliphilum]|uniref:Hydroxylamine reductase n=1 Tax=Candidatus Syntrophocurvum alkaliphilum TaxID=2293317 RepID=A0A6I6DEP3_9FIRM|nr:hydroxylamine reductase [Candidatus Syntrophocurvum alkaliphilum]QGT99676.1 Hydroxylamine reductase [Candidatus Syntrophocurvum alkaliphilum]